MAGAAIQRVVAIVAHKAVVAIAARQDVIAKPAGQRVIATKFGRNVQRVGVGIKFVIQPSRHAGGAGGT